MPSERVSEPGVISLNAVRYRIKGEVQRSLASVYPPKIIQGDTGRDSHPRLSTVTFRDSAGGLGVERVDDDSHLRRARYSTCYIFSPGHITLQVASDSDVGGLPTNTTNNDITTLVAHEGRDRLFATLDGGDEVWYATATGGTWTKADTLDAIATDAISVRMGGTEYVVWAFGTGYSYSDGATFPATDDTTDAEYLTFWDDKLWGIDSTGQLWYASTIGTEVNDAQLPLPDGYVQALFTGPDANGSEIIYAATKNGLWAHDPGNARFVRTGLRIPHNDYAGLGATTWNGDIYFPVVMTVYRYTPTSGIITQAGMDRDSGIERTLDRGAIRQMVPAHNMLLAVLGGSAGSDIGNSLWAYNGYGWMFITSLGNETLVDGGAPASKVVLVTSVLGAHRAWAASGMETESGDPVKGTIIRVDLPAEGLNPINSTAQTYKQSGLHFYPWFDAGQPEVDKIAVRAHVEVRDVDDGYVDLGYETNHSGGPTYFTRVESDGTATFDFPNSTDPAGVAFRAISFYLRMGRGSTTTERPVVENVTLEYRKKLAAKYGFVVNLDMNGVSPEGQDSEAQRDSLITAIASNTLLEFTYRDRDGNDWNHFVDVVRAEGTDSTGNNWDGSVQLVLTEL